MTDPGWAIPGVPRDVPESAQGTDGSAAPAAGAGGSGRAAGAGGPGGTVIGRGRGSRTPRMWSVSALAGSSAGAFAGAADPLARSAHSAELSEAASILPPAPSSAPAPSSPSASSAAGSQRAGSPDAAGGVQPNDAAQALAFVSAGLDFLAHADPASWPDGLQADCLRALAVAESRQAAAHARVLAVFSRPGGGLAGDGHRSPRVWLSWQCAATRRAALSSVGWMRRLGEHPAVAAALADGGISLSWAGQICEWTDRLPASVRDSADEELLSAAGNGAGLTDLAFIAEDLRRQHARPDTDDDGFEDRSLRLAATLDGAGRLTGDLTPRCATAFAAVLDSLARPGGPEDTRTLAQLRHDALEEACLLTEQQRAFWLFGRQGSRRGASLPGHDGSGGSCSAGRAVAGVHDGDRRRVGAVSAC